MFRSTSNFDKLLDKATSNLRLEPDWPAILQICDLIRQGDSQPKYALAAIKKKLYNANPHIAIYGLLVLESCVKNCGNLIHDEIGTKAYMEQLRDLVKTTAHENVRTKVLELIQAWAYAFRNSPKYRAVQDTVNIMKTEGYKFPALKESDAMFTADTAPEWADGECCHRCRVQFGVVQRKHHCRACGQVFCSQCSSKTSTLPKFGIEKEVRVCEACFDTINKSTVAGAGQKAEGELPPEYVSSSLAQQNQTPARKTEEELREEEELQLALALSKSEAEHKEKEKKRSTSAMSGTTAIRGKQYSPPPVQESDRNSPTAAEEEDPELARYLNRSYWEQRQADEDKDKHTADRHRTGSPLDQLPSAPATLSSPMATVNRLQKQENGESDVQLEEFVSALKSQVEIFVNRMRSNSSRGRSIANDSSVQTLFMNITAMHSRLLRFIQQQDDNRVYYEGLQDKLAQVKDARAALDALREEHQEKLRRQAEEAERIRQMQMAQKLELTRKKKQEYLQYQRQMALQRIQEQEREMQMRQEQQKRQYLMGSAMPYPMPYPMPGADGSPVHAQYVPGPAMPYPGMVPATTGAQGAPYSMEYPQYTMPGPGAGPPIQGVVSGTNMIAMPRGPMPISQGAMGPMGPMPGQIIQGPHGPIHGPMQQVLPVAQMQAPPMQQGPAGQMQAPPMQQGPTGQMQSSTMQQGPTGQMQGPPMQQGPTGQMQGPPMQQGPTGQMQAPPMQQGPTGQMQAPPMQQGPTGQMQAPRMQQGPTGQMQAPPMQQGLSGRMQGPPGQMQGIPGQMQGPPGQHIQGSQSPAIQMGSGGSQGPMLSSGGPTQVAPAIPGQYPNADPLLPPTGPQLQQTRNPDSPQHQPQQQNTGELISFD